MSRAAALVNRATEALYDAVIDPGAWDEVMRTLRALFHSRVEALYCLDLHGRSLHPVRVKGVERAQIKRFAASFYLSAAMTARWPSTRSRRAWWCSTPRERCCRRTGRRCSCWRPARDFVCAAARAHMSYATARWYLKLLFQKTGCSRQSELTALLARVTPSARPRQLH
jgi:hypothetical protein